MSFGPNGTLHIMMVNFTARNAGLPVGFYHYSADLSGGNLTDGSTVSWSDPELILERDQSTGTQSDSSYSSAQQHRSELHMAGDGTLYAAMYNDTDL